MRRTTREVEAGYSPADARHRLVVGALALHAQMEAEHAELAERVRAHDEDEECAQRITLGFETGRKRVR